MEKRAELIKGLKTLQEYKEEFIIILKELPELVIKSKGVITLELADKINNYMIRLHELVVLIEVLNNDKTN